MSKPNQSELPNVSPDFSTLLPGKKIEDIDVPTLVNIVSSHITQIKNELTTKKQNAHAVVLNILQDNLKKEQQHIKKQEAPSLVELGLGDAMEIVMSAQSNDLDLEKFDLVHLFDVEKEKLDRIEESLTNKRADFANAMNGVRISEGKKENKDILNERNSRKKLTTDNAHKEKLNEIIKLKTDYAKTALSISEKYNNLLSESNILPPELLLKEMEKTEQAIISTIENLDVENLKLLSGMTISQDDQGKLNALKEALRNESIALEDVIGLLYNQGNFDHFILNLANNDLVLLDTQINRYQFLFVLMKEFGQEDAKKSLVSKKIDADLKRFLSAPNQQKILATPTIALCSTEQLNTFNDAELRQQVATDRTNITTQVQSANSIEDIEKIYCTLFPTNKEKLTELFKLRKYLKEEKATQLYSKYQNAANNLRELDPYKKIDIDYLFLPKKDETIHQTEARNILNENLNTLVNELPHTARRAVLAAKDEVNHCIEMMNELLDAEKDEIEQYKQALAIPKEPSFLTKCGNLMAALFQPGKKLVDLSDDVWYAARGFLNEEIVDAYGPLIVGGASGFVALGETYIGGQETIHAINNANESTAVSKGAAGAATVALAGTALGSAVAYILATHGILIFGALTAAITPALPVIIPALMTITYGVKLARDSYHLHLAKKEEERTRSDVAETKAALNRLSENFDTEQTPHSIRIRIFELQGKLLAQQEAYKIARDDRLEAERNVSFAATEFISSAIVTVGVVLGTALLVGAALGTAGTGILVAGVAIGLGAKIFEKIDQHFDHKCTKYIRSKFVEMKEWLGFKGDEPAINNDRVKTLCTPTILRSTAAQMTEKMRSSGALPLMQNTSDSSAQNQTAPKDPSKMETIFLSNDEDDIIIHDTERDYTQANPRYIATHSLLKTPPRANTDGTQGESGYVPRTQLLG